MKKFILPVALLLGCSVAFAQEPSEKKEEYKFTPVKELKITPIENQARSSTCWSFSGQGFLEAEMLRKGVKPVNLSEMFVVSHSYKDKARDYVRMDGNLNFAPGGSFYDVIYVLKHYGAVPESLMTGLNYGTEKHVHSELDHVAKAFVKAVVDNPNKKLTPVWQKAFGALVDAYLGDVPEDFVYNGKKYTPKSFAQSLGLNADDYVSITSFSHHPFYSKFAIAIPDNWRHALSYNVPLDDFMEIIDKAIENGYPVAWGTDVSEIGFTRDGIGVLLDIDAAENSGSDQARWVGASHSDKARMIRDIVDHVGAPEVKVTQESRQEGYDNKQTTDDHGMLIFGIAKDQTGKPFYMVKNSWGETGKYKGVWYVSKPFVAGKTINILVHKDAVPKAIRAKLGF